MSKQIKVTTQSSTTGAKQIKTKAQSSTTGAQLLMYFVNAIIDESTGEVNILAIVNCDTGMINAVIDLVTGEQKLFQHLISDDETRKVWDPAMCSEVE